MCLLWGANLRLGFSWQISTVHNPRKTWLARGSLLTIWWRMPVSGLRLEQPLSSSFGCHTPASQSPVGERDLYAAGLLSFGIRSIICSVSRRGCELEPSVGKFSPFFFFSPSLVIPQFGLLSHVSSFRLSFGVQAQSLP